MDVKHAREEAESILWSRVLQKRIIEIGLVLGFEMLLLRLFPYILFFYNKIL